MSMSTTLSQCRCSSSKASNDLKSGKTLKASKKKVIERKVNCFIEKVFENLRKDSPHETEDKSLVSCCCPLNRCFSTMPKKSSREGCARFSPDEKIKSRPLDQVAGRPIDIEHFDHKLDERFIPYALECVIGGAAEMLSGIDPDRAKWYRCFANLALLPIRTTYKPENRGTVQSVLSSKDLSLSKGRHPACDPSFVSKTIKIVQPKHTDFKTTLTKLTGRRTHPQSTSARSVAL